MLPYRTALVLGPLARDLLVVYGAIVLDRKHPAGIAIARSCCYDTTPRCRCEVDTKFQRCSVIPIIDLEHHGPLGDVVPHQGLKDRSRIRHRSSHSLHTDATCP